MMHGTWNADTTTGRAASTCAAFGGLPTTGGHGRGMMSSSEAAVARMLPFLWSPAAHRVCEGTAEIKVGSALVDRLSHELDAINLSE